MAWVVSTKRSLMQKYREFRTKVGLSVVEIVGVKGIVTVIGSVEPHVKMFHKVGVKLRLLIVGLVGLLGRYLGTLGFLWF